MPLTGSRSTQPLTSGSAYLTQTVRLERYVSAIQQRMLQPPDAAWPRVDLEPPGWAETQLSRRLFCSSVSQ
ncbi:MAG: hypothetical protein AAF283_04900 [Cyanobacteria bacterium P01_A01_bin.70]